MIVLIVGTYDIGNEDGDDILETAFGPFESHADDTLAAMESSLEGRERVAYCRRQHVIGPENFKFFLGTV